MELIDIKNEIEREITEQLNRCGLMFRIFGRVKTQRSIRHKMEWKGEKYRKGNGKMQDIIGLRIVLYFPEDVEVLGFFFSCQDLVSSSIDTPGVDTFCPQRLNLTKSIPTRLIPAFRAKLPQEFAPFIDNTYEVQIRTIFSEGWHEVEHDLRYKCKQDWEGFDIESRALNGVIATLETAEWTMSSIFRNLAENNLSQGNLRAMMRNKLRIRLADDNFSATVSTYLQSHPTVLQRLYAIDRMVLLITLLSHKGTLPLTYDNIFFLCNRFDLRSNEVLEMESSDTHQMLDTFLAS